MKFHLVGIKGTGMSSLACVLHDMGHIVQGSDIEDTVYTEKELQKRNIKIKKLGVSVRSDYIKVVGMSFNEEGIKYNKFIDLFFKQKLIAISGTHGKTTTTKMFQQAFRQTTICGDGTGKYYNKSNNLILEACEYKDTFLEYNPYVLIINNIDYDHTDYFKTKEQLIYSYQKLAHKSGRVIMNGDSMRLKGKNIIYYGFNNNNDVKCTIIKKDRMGYVLKITYRNIDHVFRLNHYGKHMIYNYLSAITYALLYRKSLKKTTTAINRMKQPKRRQEEKQVNDVLYVSDYAHHPQELIALHDYLSHKYPSKPITIVFQSHTHTRTMHFYNEFIETLNKYDKVFIKNIFSSNREEDVYNESSDLLLGNVNYNKYNSITDLQHSSGIVVFAGAGDIYKDYKKIIKM